MTTKIPTTRIQISSPAGKGMNVEICGESDDPKFQDGSLNPLVWFQAENEGDIKFVTLSPHGLVSIPIECLEEAIAKAKTEVHSDNYYDNNSDDT